MVLFGLWFYTSLNCISTYLPLHYEEKMKQNWFKTTLNSFHKNTMEFAAVFILLKVKNFFSFILKIVQNIYSILDDSHNSAKTGISKWFFFQPLSPPPPPTFLHSWMSALCTYFTNIFHIFAKIHTNSSDKYTPIAQAKSAR